MEAEVTVTVVVGTVIDGVARVTVGARTTVLLATGLGGPP